MAVTVTQLKRSNDEAEYSVIATVDADTVTANIAHGMGANPDLTILPILQASAGLSLWAATTIDNVNIVLTKSVAVGSGNAGAQIRLRVTRNR